MKKFLSQLKNHGQDFMINSKKKWDEKLTPNQKSFITGFAKTLGFGALTLVSSALSAGAEEVPVPKGTRHHIGSIVRVIWAMAIWGGLYVI